MMYTKTQKVSEMKKLDAIKARLEAIRDSAGSEMWANQGSEDMKLLLAFVDACRQSVLTPEQQEALGALDAEESTP